MRRTYGELRNLTWLTLVACCFTAALQAQSFPSRSNGKDGDLNITAAGVTNFTQAPVGGGTVYNFERSPSRKARR